MEGMCNETVKGSDVWYCNRTTKVDGLCGIHLAKRERDKTRVPRPTYAQLRDAVERVRALADWHETKADKARRFRIEINGENPVMDKAAVVHDDAARRILAAIDPEVTP